MSQVALPKKTIDSKTQSVITMEYQLSGLVQGVGFRPFIYKLATTFRLTGWVKNCGAMVLLRIQGKEDVISQFEMQLKSNFPTGVSLASFVKNIISDSKLYDRFLITPSVHHSSESYILPDLAICKNCRTELFDEQSRRYNYPFISCTECGPRFAIQSKFPFDRENTSYKYFQPCAKCEREYSDPENRRFHSQNISCEKCGPSLLLSYNSSTLQNNLGCITESVNLLVAGKVIAIKGISGYRLYCDATNYYAIKTLRERKNRPDKPFAVMFPENNDYAVLRQNVHLTKDNLDFLTSRQAPIGLFPISKNSTIAANLFSPLSRIGAMLPATGLEILLTEQFGKPLVATSANVSNSPIIYDEENAERDLGKLADGFLHHNLEIVNPSDDSVYLNMNHLYKPIRMGRGIAPKELFLPFDVPKPMAAFGAQMKNTVALAWKNRIVLSSHNGDLGQLKNWQKCLNQLDKLIEFYNIKPQIYLRDAHPAYTSHQLQFDDKIPIVDVLHHFAHASALGLCANATEPMLVFCWDGMGYGENGELWGGETLFGKLGHWNRVASFIPFKLPGGDNVFQHPWRIAASLCWQCDLDFELEDLNNKIIKQMWLNEINSPYCSSVGRLFDAAAVILGFIETVTFDGQAAMVVEANANVNTEDYVELSWNKNDNLELVDWKPLLTLLLDKNLNKHYRATVFHNSLAQLILSQVTYFSNVKYFKQVGLSGGVFQNSLLVEKAKMLLEQNDFDVFCGEDLPCNDAGISAGQVIEYSLSDVNGILTS